MNKTGFGFLRLPRVSPEDEHSVDYELLNAMVDCFLSQGGDYFDTAYTYLGGISEEALRKTVVERYPRERYRIADKLPGYEAKSYEDNWKFFEESRRRCGVDYFDVYLLHGLNAENYEIAQKHNQFSFLQRLKSEGKVRKIGFSFHDTAQLLDIILKEHPEVDYVQLQINYLDWESVSIQARECYETAVRHGKRVIVMEPVKGGTLSAVPQKAELMLRKIHPDESIASWAIRFAASLDSVEVVLSGMNTMDQMKDNMRDLQPLNGTELSALENAAQMIREKTAVGCTGCDYCAAGCPKHIPISKLFVLYNEYHRNPSEDWKIQNIYDSFRKAGRGPESCISCGQCERKCPQKLKVMDHLKSVKEIFGAN